MNGYGASFYDAFSEVAFGGSQAAVILDAGSLDAERRARIAREIGMPATAFVDHVADDRVQVQFFSTVQELPMCGHGTLCLLTHLVEEGLLAARDGIVLCLPNSTAVVSR